MMQIWPGEPFPLGATFDGDGTNFSLFSEAATTRRAVPVRRRRRGNARRPAGGHGALLARLPARTSGPASATASACTARGHPSRGTGAIRTSCCSIPTPRRSTARGRGTRRCSPITSTIPSRLAERSRQRARTCRSRSSSIRPSTGRATRRRDTPWHKTVIYETHVKGFTKRHPRAARAAARHLRRPGASRRDRVPAAARRHRGRAAAGPPVRPGLDCCSSAGLRNYWGYNSIGYFAPHNEYSSQRARAASRCRSSSTMVKTLHDAGIEVILDVVYNHTAEGNHLGPMLSFKGIDNARVLPADGGQPPLLHGLHRHRQHAEHAAPARAAAA